LEIAMPKSDVYLPLIGKRFNRLLVLGWAEPLLNEKGQVKSQRFLCQCDCGNTKVIVVTSLIAERSQSCGCIRREQLTKRNTRHGNAVRGNLTTYYNIWLSMIQRCENPRNPSYKNYGGRGIGPHEPWKQNFSTFLNEVIAEIGERPPGTTLDRINNDLGYQPGNIRWATRKVQNNNRRPQRPAHLPPRRILRKE
jgi:hypothetical protein